MRFTVDARPGLAGTPRIAAPAGPRPTPGVPWIAAALALLVTACGDDATPETTPDAGVDPCKASPPDVIPEAPIHTPRWAFEPWISKDISDTADTYDFVGGFEERDIPVGVVVLDSPWETHYNTFVPSPDALPRVRQARRRPPRAGRAGGALGDPDGQRLRARPGARR
jgi:hypothetical protein